MCVLIGAKGAVYPLETLDIVPGQQFRGDVPPHVTSQMVLIASTRPDRRLEDIVAANQVRTSLRSLHVAHALTMLLNRCRRCSTASPTFSAQLESL